MRDGVRLGHGSGGRRDGLAEVACEGGGEVGSRGREGRGDKRGGRRGQVGGWGCGGGGEVGGTGGGGGGRGRCGRGVGGQGPRGGGPGGSGERGSSRNKVGGGGRGGEDGGVGGAWWRVGGGAGGGWGGGGVAQVAMPARRAANEGRGVAGQDAQVSAMGSSTGPDVMRTRSARGCPGRIVGGVRQWGGGCCVEEGGEVGVRGAGAGWGRGGGKGWTVAELGRQNRGIRARVVRGGDGRGRGSVTGEGT